MKPHALSMSKVDLALGGLDDPPSGCLYGFRADATRVYRESGAAARIGTLVHKIAEAAVKNQPGNVVPPATDEEREAWALYNGPLKVWLKTREWTASELGLRYDAENDATLMGPRRGDPGYDDHGPMVLPGTLDLVHVVDGLAHVVDLKTGKKENAHPEQLYAQAVAVSRFYGVTTVRVGFAFVRKRLSPEPQWETLDEDRLDEEAGKLRRALRMLPTAEPRAGDWCWRCDARPACPAFSGDSAADSAAQ